MYSPPEWKSWIPGQGDILLLADVPPPPQEWKSWIQVKVTFWFWLMYTPPRNWNWTKHECYRNKNHFKRGHQVHFTNLPPSPLPLPLSDSMPEQETGEFQFQMDLWTQTPSTTLSSQNKMKCSFLDCIQLLMIGWAGRWTRTPSTTLLQPKKMKCSFLDYVQLLMIGWAGRWTRTPSTTPLQPKNEMLIFGLCSMSDDQPGWSMDSNPIHHPSLAKKWNAHFWITFNFWWLAGLVDGLEPHPPPFSSQKNKMLIFGLRSTFDFHLGWLMDSNPICHPL